ncbi:MAG: hypothetical protein CMP59_08685 [Flavobacteriales bacterium]|nr:hypothetical protein [Flavobacteriales bacterium]|tara:strand:- start:1317 stop:2543 length:1227 start_codon:yes stop_codon:yes gene_type:complete
MKNVELKNAIIEFQPLIHDIQKSREDSYEIAREFRKFYTIKALESMPFEHYALGHYEPADGSPLFCYTIEHKLKELGKITGSTSFKFGVYYGQTKSDPVNRNRFVKRFGSNFKEAYRNVRNEIIDLVKAGKLKDTRSIVRNQLSPMFKGKILTTFYPNDYLNIFSNRHLDYFLVQLNLDNNKILDSDPVLKRETLLAFKIKDPQMKLWSNDIFMYFLYHMYPKGPDQERTSNDSPVFPNIQKPVWVDLDIYKGKKTSSYTRSNGKNKDYEGEARRNKLHGNRGEKIVLEMEKQRLAEVNDRPDLAKKVHPAKYDYLGYDIESIELDGTTKRYIEVKSTTARVGETTFFISKNEFEKAQELTNYQIYLVYEVTSTQPKVCILGNPFNPQDKKFELTPISYKVNFKSQKK